MLPRRTAQILVGASVWLLTLSLHSAPTASAAILPIVTDRVDRAAAQAVARQTVVGQRADPVVLAVFERAVADEPLAQTPAEAVAPVQVAVPRAAPAPAIGANAISIGRLGLRQPVGWYTDCTGAAPVPRWGAWRWNCAGANNTYILAHNPGVFTPILGLHPGDIVQYGDPGGAVHTYRVTTTTIVNNTELWPLDPTPTASLTLQTCWTWDGSRDFIVRAIQI